VEYSVSETGLFDQSGYLIIGSLAWILAFQSATMQQVWGIKGLQRNRSATEIDPVALLNRPRAQGFCGLLHCCTSIHGSSRERACVVHRTVHELRMEFMILGF